MTPTNVLTQWAVHTNNRQALGPFVVAELGVCSCGQRVMAMVLAFCSQSTPKLAHAVCGGWQQQQSNRLCLSKGMQLCTWFSG